MTPRPTVGCVLQLAPATGVVEFTTDSECWTEPLIAYAVVVTCAGPSVDYGMGEGEYETNIDPVLLEDGYPKTITNYLAGRSPGVNWRVRL